jgi:DNA-binding winged helix-turn-helix (wHTH) protein/Tol biopolymer transport system component
MQRKIYEFGPYRLDTAQMLLSRDGSVVPLQPRAIETLLALVRGDGQVVSKQDLMNAVWPDSFVEESNLSQNVFLLRRELGRTAEGEEYIQTVPRRGYRINVPVAVIGPENRRPQVSSKQVSTVNGKSPVQPVAVVRPGWVVAAGPALAIAALVAMAIGAGWFWRAETARPSASGYRQITKDGAPKRVHTSQLGGPDAALFTDGTRVYFAEGSSEAPAIFQVSVNGGETARIATPLELPALLDYSLSRSELLLSGSEVPAAVPPLWTLPVPAGTAHRIGELSAWDAAWSPDGHELAFVMAEGLFCARSDGSGAVLVAKLPGRGWQPRWSPDGKRLRLTVFDVVRSTHSLWEVGRDGSGLKPLLPGWRAGASPEDGPVDLCCGRWTPDGEFFVFQASYGDRSEIWSIPGQPRVLAGIFPSLDEPVQVTNGQLSSTAPTFSPDGQKLFVIGQQQRGELQRYDARTGEFVQFLNGISAESVDISRDGNSVVYVAYPEGTVWRSRVDGSDRVQLTFPPLKALVPQWSPDGSRIAFYVTGGADRQRLYIVPANGGAARPASANGGGEMSPHWSSDGKSILYSDFPFFSANPGSVAVHRLNLKSQAVETLPGSEGLFGPTCSPDGRYATAMALDGQRIMLFDFHSRTWSELARGSGLPRWSPNSEYLYYLRYGPESAVMRERVSDRKTEIVASLKGMRMAGRMAGLDFGLTPQGDPIVLKDVGTQEIYALTWREP